jgi:cytochrome c-type biogenesis protein CcmH/NrfF
MTRDLKGLEDKAYGDSSKSPKKKVSKKYENRIYYEPPYKPVSLALWPAGLNFSPDNLNIRD